MILKEIRFWASFREPDQKQSYYKLLDLREEREKEKERIIEKDLGTSIV